MRMVNHRGLLPPGGICSLTQVALANVDLRSGVSGHRPKRGDAEKECAEGVTQRPPI